MTTNMEDKTYSTRKLRVLELYSGIGGMHWALKESGMPYDVVMAVDINTTANEIYRQNFPHIDLQCFGIEKLTLKKLASLSCNAVLMSPPCQPFTRVGKKADCDDVRTKSFLHLLQLIQRLDNKPHYILVENVKGFETSRTRQLLVDTLQTCSYTFQEFLLNPLQFGIPNGRLRYYLTARLTPWPGRFQPQEEILQSLPELWNHSCQLGDDEGALKMACNGCTNQSDDSRLHLTQSQQQQQQQQQTLPDSPSGQSDKASSNYLSNFSTSKDGLSSSGESDSTEALVTAVKESALRQSPLCPAKHSCDNDDNVESEVKKFKSSEAHFEAKDSNCASARQGEMTDLLNAGRNMRYCEEEDALINSDSRPLLDYMETGDEKDFEAFLLSDKNLFQFLVMDIVLPVLKKSTCFTKRYGHYIEGAGSVVQMSSSVEATKAASALKSRTVDLRNKHEWQEEELSVIRQLKLRYFTPREVANLMCFPPEFTFPDGFSSIRKYRVLGNSLNVHVVSRLIKFMVVS